MPSPPPWATGPAEILEHGLQLLDEDTDAARRLAMISIDNAVELTIRTYLGLPRRITGLTITRRKFAEISESFPDMLDALEEHASDLIGELNLGEIEWFHRVRNQLYHDGNGLTVDRRHVAVYAVIARVVWETLLGGPGDDDLSGKKGDPPEPPPSEKPRGPAMTKAEPTEEQTELLRIGTFLRRWTDLETALADFVEASTTTLPRGPRVALAGRTTLLVREGLIPAIVAREIRDLQQVRNEVVHGPSGEAPRVSDELLDRLTRVTQTVRSLTEGRQGKGNEGATSPAETGRDALPPDNDEPA
jgi:hypothetical protein